LLIPYLRDIGRQGPTREIQRTKKKGGIPKFKKTRDSETKTKAETVSKLAEGQALISADRGRL